jgi:hypothetical protein
MLALLQIHRQQPITPRELAFCAHERVWYGAAEEEGAWR